MKSKVYFIKSDAGPIKIGMVENGDTRARMRDLQVGSAWRLEVLAECPGDRRLERKLHKAFGKEHMRGEWFRASDRLVALVHHVRDGLPLGDFELPDPYGDPAMSRRLYAALRGRREADVFVFT